MSSVETRLVTQVPVGELFTADDLERLPAEDRLELIRGELCPMPNNGAEHGLKTMGLSAPIASYVDEHDLGECFAAETRFTIEIAEVICLAPSCPWRSASVNFRGVKPASKICRI